MTTGCPTRWSKIVLDAEDSTIVSIGSTNLYYAVDRDVAIRTLGCRCPWRRRPEDPGRGHATTDMAYAVTAPHRSNSPVRRIYVEFLEN